MAHSLKVLKIAENSIDDADLQEILMPVIPVMPNLSELDLSRNPLTGTSITDLMK